MSTKIWIIACIVCAAAGGYVSRQYMPKIVTDTKEEVKKEVVVIHKEKKPDGTIITDTTKTKDSHSSSTKQKSVYVLPPNWLISASYNNKAVYGVLVQRRILGPVLVGVALDSTKTVTATIGIEF